VVLKPKHRKKRKEQYDGQVKATLAKIWEIFDYPCGQRLKPEVRCSQDAIPDADGIRTDLRGGQRRATKEYLSLNSAELKRSIDAKSAKLYKAYERKKNTQQADPYKKLVPNMVTSYMMQEPELG
jgi:hypothetical protein